MKWQTVRSENDQSEVDIHINDFIGDWIDDYFGFGVTSQAFIREIQNLPEAVRTIRLHLNSPGGDMVAGNHIANVIRDQQSHKGRTVEVLIEGAAFSAATLISSAGKPTKMADNALFMIHDPWTVGVGNAREMRKQADTLDKFRDTAVAAYQWKSPLDAETLKEMMADETWLSADEAIEHGFVDAKIEGVHASGAGDVAGIGPRGMPKVPEKYRERVQSWFKSSNPKTSQLDDPPSAVHAPTAASPSAAPEPSPAPRIEIVATEEERTQAAIAQAAKDVKEIVALCTAAGVPDMVGDFVGASQSLDQVRDRLKDADAIRGACVAIGLPGGKDAALARASGYIKSGLNIGEVRDRLNQLKTSLDQVEIDNKFAPDSRATKNKSGAEIDILDIYARRRPKR